VNRDSGTDRANGGWLRRLVRQHKISHVCLLFFNITMPATKFSMAIVEYIKAMFGVGDFAKQIAEPVKQTAAKKLMPAPTFQFLLGVAFINVCAFMLPNVKS
jgi:hypothetical protein